MAHHGMTGWFESGVKPASEPDDKALAFAFSKRRLLVHHEEGQLTAQIPTLGELEKLSPVRRQFLGNLERRQVFSVELEDEFEAPAGMALYDLRRLYGLLLGHGSVGEDYFVLAGRAIQIIDWDRDHQFCSRCQTPMETAEDDRVKKCPSCGLSDYPRLAPAVIVLVERDDECLLGRSPHFPEGMFSTLAGFVEPGETMEEAVVREIEEEVGVQVGDARYFGSQPWPFPHSLMVGFHAQYKSGEIKVDGVEVVEAAWFKADGLPRIPPRISIARSLIEDFLARMTSK